MLYNCWYLHFVFWELYVYIPLEVNTSWHCQGEKQSGSVFSEHFCPWAATCGALSPTGSCFWVAVLDGNVVGIVAARGNEEDNTVELRRMSVDSNYRGKGIAKALGRKVLEFAMLNNYSSVVLGTTAVKMAAHKLYESLGFKHVGVVEHYALPGMTHSLLERMFFQLRYHRYRLQLREE